MFNNNVFSKPHFFWKWLYTVNNSQRVTIDVRGNGLWPPCKNINRQGKIFNPNRLKEIIEILQSHILYSFAEQSIKKIFSEQHAY